jgi:hypothetical protein
MEMTGPARRFKASIQTAVYLFACLAIAAVNTPAGALDAAKDEKTKLKACEKKLCRAIMSRSPKGNPIACKLNKTWAKKKIKKGAGQKSLKWGFGDARCLVDLKLDRKHIADAMTAKKYSLFLPPHTVKCDVETEDGVKPVRVVLAPKIKFKRGRAFKAWLKVKNVEGPGMIKGLVWTTARLEDSLGIFHREMIKAINKFMHTQCVERYSKR